MLDSPKLTLTMHEKADLLSGRDFWSTQSIQHAGIESVLMTDGPHGIRLQRNSGEADLTATCFPLAVAVGSSWNVSVAREVGAAVAREARAAGIGVVLGPGVNIKRSPLCGRNFEYYSEDPLLSGMLGSAHVTAQQAAGVGASVKHFAANNQETERMQISADVDERTLREIYLPAFERVVTEAHPATVMAAYNKVNGQPASANRWLLTDVLRGEWGYEGAVVSDWGAVSDPVASLQAGLDLVMPGTSGRSARKIVDAVADRHLDESVVDRAVGRVLALSRLAIDPAGEIDMESHHTVARELAAECAVLLKNEDQVLPLRHGTSIAVIGEFARSPRYQGAGSSRVTASRVDEPLTEMRGHAASRGCDISFATGFAPHDEEGGAESVDELHAEAVVAAGAADIAVVFVGLAAEDESEGFDRFTLDLPASQIALIRAVAVAAPKTVVVLSHGGVVSLEGWHDEVDAILDGFLLGQAGGGALADLLFGVANPSGRLAETIPFLLSDTGSYTTFPGEQGHARYGEGVMVGYRWHESAHRPARYPFGHGLSYTSFDVSDVAVTSTGDDTAETAVTVTNTGTRAGAYVVQVYVSTDAGPVRRPLRELRAFSKVHLDPAESRTVRFALSRRAFAYWDIRRSDWVVPRGDYAVQICQDAATVTAEQSVTLIGDAIVDELTLESTIADWRTHQVVGPKLMSLLTALPADRGLPAVTPELLRMIDSMPMQKVADMLSEALPASVFEDLMALSREKESAS